MIKAIILLALLVFYIFVLFILIVDFIRIVKTIKVCCCKHNYKTFTEVNGIDTNGKPCIYPIYYTEICTKCGKQKDESIVWDLGSLRND